MVNHRLRNVCIKQIKIFFSPPAQQNCSRSMRPKWWWNKFREFHFCTTWWILMRKIENCRNNPLSQFSRDVDEKWHVLMWLLHENVEDCNMRLVQHLFELWYFLQNSYLDRLNYLLFYTGQSSTRVYPCKMNFTIFSRISRKGIVVRYKFCIEIKLITCRKWLYKIIG